MPLHPRTRPTRLRLRPRLAALALVAGLLGASAGWTAAAAESAVPADGRDSYVAAAAGAGGSRWRRRARGAAPRQRGGARGRRARGARPAGRHRARHGPAAGARRGRPAGGARGGAHRDARPEPADRPPRRASGSSTSRRRRAMGAFVLQLVDDPLPGVERALVIAGSDKRGTIFGIYDLSAADRRVALVLVGRRAGRAASAELYVLPGPPHAGQPEVKYRGIFINDEAPGAVGLGAEKFGGFNQQFYEKVFELILRTEGQLPLAGDVGQGLQRGRSRETRARRRVRHRDGHLASRADDARAEEWRRTARARGTTRPTSEAARVLAGRASSARAPTRASSPSACAATATSR